MQSHFGIRISFFEHNLNSATQTCLKDASESLVALLTTIKFMISKNLEAGSKVICNQTITQFVNALAMGWGLSHGHRVTLDCSALFHNSMLITLAKHLDL